MRRHGRPGGALEPFVEVVPRSSHCVRAGACWGLSCGSVWPSANLKTLLAGGVRRIGSRMGESFPAVFAFEWLFSSVDSFVLLEGIKKDS